MIRRPPRSTLDRSSAASDVYKRHTIDLAGTRFTNGVEFTFGGIQLAPGERAVVVRNPVSYTHLRAHETVLDRAHETVLDLECRLLLEKKTQPRPARKSLLENDTIQQEYEP